LSDRRRIVGKYPRSSFVVGSRFLVSPRFGGRDVSPVSISTAIVARRSSSLERGTLRSDPHLSGRVSAVAKFAIA
jgi:hypothetical protein